MSLLMQGMAPLGGVFQVTNEQALKAMHYVDSKHRDSSIGKLFWPNELGDSSDVNWEDITPAMAVKAIDSFLMTGKPSWKEVVAA